jgi:ribosomal protein S18 acetylase RimI-like enzyme
VKAGVKESTLLRHDGHVLIEPIDPERVVEATALWHDVGLTRPWNDARSDIDRALRSPASSVLAGTQDGRLIATAMVGHDGHRGWVYYLAVRRDARRAGVGREMMRACEAWLRDRGVPKLNLMVRGDNQATVDFYRALGYAQDDVLVLSRRLEN